MNRLVPVALWSVMALAVLAGGWLFLRACGTWSVAGFALNYCPTGDARRALAEEGRIGEDLRRQIHAAEIRVAEAPFCALPTPTPVIAPPPAPVIQPDRRSQDIQDRLQQRDARAGSLQISLAWDTLDDLDLTIDCPGGRISSNAGKKGPGICGDGVKDVDANNGLTENVSSRPVENIVWQNQPPAGQYDVRVHAFMKKDENRRYDVPFTLRIRADGSEKTCTSAIVAIPVSEGLKNDSGQPISGYGRRLTFTVPGLPECDFKQANTIRTNQGKD